MHGIDSMAVVNVDHTRNWWMQKLQPLFHVYFFSIQLSLWFKSNHISQWESSLPPPLQDSKISESRYHGLNWIVIKVDTRCLVLLSLLLGLSSKWFMQKTMLFGPHKGTTTWSHRANTDSFTMKSAGRLKSRWADILCRCTCVFTAIQPDKWGRENEVRALEVAWHSFWIPSLTIWPAVSLKRLFACDKWALARWWQDWHHCGVTSVTSSDRKHHWKCRQWTELILNILETSGFFFSLKNRKRIYVFVRKPTLN